MLTCSKCGSKIPAQSRFCLSCGAPVQQPAQQMVRPVRPSGPAPPPARPEVPQAARPKRRIKAVAVVVGLLIALLALLLCFHIRGARLLQAARPSNPQQLPILRAPSVGVPNGPSVLVPPAIPNPPQPGILQSEAPKASPESGPPADVVAYLDYVRRVDAYRLQLQDMEKGYLYKLLPDLLSDLKKLQGDSQNVDVDPEEFSKSKEQVSGQASKDMDTLINQWQTVLVSFRKVPAPESCQTLAWKYSDALGEVVLSSTDILRKLANKDLSLTGMQNQSSKIDSKLDASDSEVSAICQRFGIRKSFTIQSDRGNVPGLLTP